MSDLVVIEHTQSISYDAMPRSHESTCPSLFGSPTRRFPPAG